MRHAAAEKRVRGGGGEEKKKKKPEAGSVATEAVGVREATRVREGYPGLPLGSILTSRATATAGVLGPTRGLYMDGS
ncbi:hypothetical protein MRX96_053571 [Rhipicephalus microplus]